ncbi:MAG: phosphate acyltransferase [Oscillospiraceae bacterium]|nr:phosphate acyltransferase [Oscillospiraceae bacterium]
MKITCFDDLATRAKKAKHKTAVAVAEAQDSSTIESVISAAAEGIIRPILIGDDQKIRQLVEKAGAFPMDFEIISSDGVSDSLDTAAQLIHSGQANALMKGAMDTAIFMKTVLHKRNHLLAGGRLSLAGFFQLPSYHKLFAISDMGINITPDFDTKRAIVDNAISMLHSLGLSCPKVAILSSTEKLSAKQLDTVDADALKKLGDSDNIRNCIIEGPISFDLATSAKAAKAKGFQSPVAGDADLLIVPDVVSGNILAKCLTGMAGAQTAGTVLGAKVPIILTSRSAEPSDKFYSIALAACLGN